MKQHTYIAIDLKSFYASVECRERGLDPLDTNLVVADESRTDKTICLAVTPSLKSYGISGRGRLFEVKQRVKEANAGRQHDAPGRRLDGTSHFFSELQANPSLACLLYTSLGGDNFYERYCMDDTISREEDGTINAGYAVWRELIAELIAFELDDNCDVVPLRRKKDLLSYYEGELLTGNGKMGVSMILCEAMTSDAVSYTHLIHPCFSRRGLYSWECRACSEPDGRSVPNGCLLYTSRCV